MQSKLDLEKLVQPSLSDDQVKTRCVNCETFPFEVLKNTLIHARGGGEGVVEEAALMAARVQAAKEQSAWDQAAKVRAVKERDTRGKAAQ